MRELKTQEEFEKVLSDAGDKPVFVDFSAGWCGPCKRIGPKFEDFSKEFTAAEFYKIDIDVNDDVTEKYGIQSVPTFICFKNGMKVERFSGADEDKLRAFIEKHCQ